jgi:flagellar hook assembly protein FlgD
MTTFPNPLRQATTVNYTVSEAGHVEIVVYDVNGRQVRTLLGRHVEAGLHRATWDGRDDAGRSVGSGEYFMRIRTATGDHPHKVVVVR